MRQFDLVRLISVNRLLLIAIALCFPCCLSGAASSTEFLSAFEQSTRDEETATAKRYTREVKDKIFSAIVPEMSTCMRQRDTTDSAMLVFIISADGEIRRALSAPGREYGECIVSKLRLPISVSRPPHDNFAVALGILGKLLDHRRPQ
jgi:hypothetical protein